MALTALRLRDDVRELTSALDAAGLPTEDVGASGQTFFRFSDELGSVGYGGWEGQGDDRLLRSLVILPPQQNRGLGRQVLALLEHHALEAGALRLHLLTTGAEDFFRRQGYQDAVRSEAPASVRLSREFRALCPESAIYLTKSLVLPAHAG